MILSQKALHLYGKKLFERARIIPPFKRANHLSNEACLLFFSEGGNNHYSQSERVKVTNGDGILMKCGNFFFDLIPDESSGNSEMIAIHFYPNVLKQLFKNKLPKFLIKSKNSASIQYMTEINGNQVLAAYMETIMLLFKNPSLADEEVLALKLKEIILILSKINNSGVQQILKNLFNPTSVAFKQTIEAHLFSQLSLDDLASLTNNSLSTFQRQFKKFYETTPANYIKNKRLERAADLLKISDLSITEISDECIFSDIAHFSNSFKEKYNSTPSVYRLENISK
ncbi:MAG: AraC-like DNA-binding protein [Saprospiraceae bacterium]|jgi:AraC-like DNA-binding protein